MDNHEKIVQKVMLGIMEKVISPHIGVIYVHHEFEKFLPNEEQRWKLHIVIDDKTTISEMRKAWIDILMARDNLMEYQGQEPNLFSTMIFKFIDDYKFTGIKDSYFSKIMNFLSLVYLIREIKEEASVKNEITMNGYFYSLLRTFQIKKPNVQIWKDNGRNKLLKNQLPWDLTHGPITVRRVIDTLISFKEQQENQIFIFPPVQEYDRFSLIHAEVINLHYWEDAEDLLMKNKPKQYNNFKLEINSFYNDILFECKRYVEDKFGIISDPDGNAIFPSR